MWESSWTRDRTSVSSIDRWTLNHWTTREAPNISFFRGHNSTGNRGRVFLTRQQEITFSVCLLGKAEGCVPGLPRGISSCSLRCWSYTNLSSLPPSSLWWCELTHCSQETEQASTVNKLFVKVSCLSHLHNIMLIRRVPVMALGWLLEGENSSLQESYFANMLKVREGNSLRGPVVRTWHFHCQGLGSNPDWGTKIPQAFFNKGGHPLPPQKERKMNPSHVWTRTFWLSTVQFSRSVMSDSFWPHGLQHARLPCPSPTPGAYLIKFMPIASVMPSNHLILCRPLLLLP